ncbi:MAG: HupE/UreJ family protein [Gammaproteobacteria bacterium]|nr:HupE/UreJ family protein [Gammaproteobacteria bacterium]
MSAKRFLVVCLSLWVVPEVSLAHSSIQGIGTFYNGLLHPILVPAHLLLLVAVGLFLGQQDSKAIQPALGVFAFATIAGLTAAWFFTASQTETLILVLSAVIGLVIAVSPKIPLLLSVVIALLAGFLLGSDSAQEALSDKDKFVTLFGNGVAIYFLVFYSMVLVDYLNKKAWQRIGIRIVGSWVAASSLLVLALPFSSQGQT